MTLLLVIFWKIHLEKILIARLCLRFVSAYFSGDPENNEKTRQNAEIKQIDFSGKIEFEGKNS